MESYKEIDRLLNILYGDTHGSNVGQLEHSHKISHSVIVKALNSGFITLYDQENQEERTIVHERYYCKITPKGSHVLHNSGLEGIEKRNKTNRYIAIATLVITFLTLVVSFFALI